MFRSTGSRVVAGLVGVAVLAGAGVGLSRRSAAPPASEVVAASPTPSRAALLPPASTRAPVPSGAGLRAALRPALGAQALGRRLEISVVDAASGSPVLESAARTPVLPASTAKLVTAVAVLSAVDPTARLATRVLAGPRPGDVVLVGGGDPTLAGPAARPGYPRTARLSDLAAQTLAALGGARVGRVLVDDRLFTGPRLGPGWRPGYVTSGNVSPVSALSVDEGRVRPGDRPRVSDPALAAGAALARLLGVGAAGQAAVVRGTAAPGARELGRVDSPPVAQLVELMLTESDNDIAEALARQVALARGQPATFAGAARAVRDVLGLDGVALVDGSGLSRLDRLQPAALTRLLARVASGREPRLAPLLSGLPVAGFDGTLAKRFRRGLSLPAAGSVRGKTGTLDGVGALAGLVRTREGRLLAFDFTADGVPVGATLDAQAALDRLAAVLAGCGCR